MGIYAIMLPSSGFSVAHFKGVQGKTDCTDLWVIKPTNQVTPSVGDDIVMFVWGLTSLLNMRSYRDGGTLTNVLSHRVDMLQTQDMTPYPGLSQFTDTGPTCRCAIHWWWTSHWNTQLLISMSGVRPPTHTRMLNLMMLLWCRGKKITCPGARDK